MSIAVYIYMAESDEYYGSRRAQEAYDGLQSAYLDVVLMNMVSIIIIMVERPYYLKMKRY